MRLCRAASDATGGSAPRTIWRGLGPRAALGSRPTTRPSPCGSGDRAAPAEAGATGDLDHCLAGQETKSAKEESRRIEVLFGDNSELKHDWRGSTTKIASSRRPWLQWGRDHVVAKMFQFGFTGFKEAQLQWGLDRMIAETSSPLKRGASSYTLGIVACPGRQLSTHSRRD